MDKKVYGICEKGYEKQVKTIFSEKEKAIKFIENFHEDEYGVWSASIFEYEINNNPQERVEVPQFNSIVSERYWHFYLRSDDPESWARGKIYGRDVDKSWVEELKKISSDGTEIYYRINGVSRNSRKKAKKRAQEKYEEFREDN